MNDSALSTSTSEHQTSAANLETLSLYLVRHLQWLFFYFFYFFNLILTFWVLIHNTFGSKLTSFIFLKHTHTCHKSVVRFQSMVNTVQSFSVHSHSCLFSYFFYFITAVTLTMCSMQKTGGSWKFTIPLTSQGRVTWWKRSQHVVHNSMRSPVEFQ